MVLYWKLRVCRQSASTNVVLGLSETFRDLGKMCFESLVLRYMILL